ncbi:uncharacterized protein BDZ99DRAFT_62350 [Mytilinidion resinicola]|uniref:Uncharacterized protein n=1 Tax=Mytilinidion resinicola TaxID=574789 RepID=A0A6A6YGG1_9PEZI|nr:uncharacterized protein BDZ99DRAFT_62350 [Mytilinidion resinicola]KAF2807668.1 hypothetical protein BDZ99DRAFT_62350 [Mytilinidion resinicola]
MWSTNSLEPGHDTLVFHKLIIAWISPVRATIRVTFGVFFRTPGPVASLIAAFRYTVEYSMRRGSIFVCLNTDLVGLLQLFLHLLWHKLPRKHDFLNSSSIRAHRSEHVPHD